MLASYPASTLNQNRPHLGIPNRFCLTMNRSSAQLELLTRTLSKGKDARTDHSALILRQVQDEELRKPRPSFVAGLAAQGSVT